MRPAWLAPLLVAALASPAVADDGKACRKLAFSPDPTAEEMQAGLEAETTVQSCDGDHCKPVGTLPAKRRVWGNAARPDCRFAALEIVTGTEPGDVELWLVDLAKATFVKPPKFRGNEDMGGGRWMSGRYVYFIPGPIGMSMDVFEPDGKRAARLEASGLSWSDDGRFVLGYPNKSYDNGDARVTLWDMRTLDHKVLIAKLAGQVDHTVPTWSADAVVLPVGKETVRFALPK